MAAPSASFPPSAVAAAVVPPMQSAPPGNVISNNTARGAVSDEIVATPTAVPSEMVASSTISSTAATTGSPSTGASSGEAITNKTRQSDKKQNIVGPISSTGEVATAKVVVPRKGVGMGSENEEETTDHAVPNLTSLPTGPRLHVHPPAPPPPPPPSAAASAAAAASSSARSSVNINPGVPTMPGGGGGGRGPMPPMMRPPMAAGYTMYPHPAMGWPPRPSPQGVFLPAPPNGIHQPMGMPTGMGMSMPMARGMPMPMARGMPMPMPAASASSEAAVGVGHAISHNTTRGAVPVQEGNWQVQEQQSQQQWQQRQQQKHVLSPPPPTELPTGSGLPLPQSSPRMVAHEVRPPTPPPAPARFPLPTVAAATAADPQDVEPLKERQQHQQQEQQPSPQSDTESAFVAAQAEAEALRKRVEELEKKLASASAEQDEAEWDGDHEVQGGKPTAGSKRSKDARAVQTKSRKRAKVSAQIKEEYRPGYVDADYTYYCTLDDETCGEVADKLGCFWKDLALANKSRYGAIREWDRFREYTTLVIPGVVKKETLMSLAPTPSNDTKAVPKVNSSMIASADTAPSPDGQTRKQSAQGLAWSVENKSRHFTIAVGDDDEAPLVPARMPSNDATRDPAVEMWANRLLGKEVEVFWEVEKDSDDDGNEYPDSDDEGDPTDWYEAKILSYNPEDGVFGVEFVGDDTTIYRMELNKNIVRPSGKRLEDPEIVVEDRGRYLDSLARRKSIDKYSNEFEEGEALDQALEDDAIFRGSLRLRAQSMLRKSLLKGMKYMGIDPATDADANAFCSLKSWELELLIFQEYGQAADNENGTYTSKHQKVSGEYKAKIKMLKSNFEDKKNPTLAPRVLSGDLDLSDLIQMAPDQLAGRQTKLKRAKAEEEAKKDIVLTPGIGTSPVKEKVVGKTINTKEISAPPLTSKLSAAPTKPSPTSIDIKALIKKKVKAAETEAAASAPAPPAAPRPSPRSSPAAKHPHASISSFMQGQMPAPPLASRTSAVGTFAYDQERSQMMHHQAAVSGGYQTVPPVKFAAAQQKHAASAIPDPQSVPTTRPGRVLNVTGGMRFRFTISGLVQESFETSFVLEGQKKLAIDRFISEKIPKESGRSKFEEFDRFIAEKLAGGRWMIAVLRLVDIHDEDAVAYKAFYKRYEEQGRIPLFKIGSDCKLFLVTPKFTRARCLGGYISSYTASYAVILLRAGTI